MLEKIFMVVSIILFFMLAVMIFVFIWWILDDMQRG